MSLKNCSISFTNCPHGVFTAGETVTGIVNINMTKKKRYKALMLKVSGEANATWKENRKSIKSNEIGKSVKYMQFTGKDEYFKVYINLLPSQDDDTITNYLNIGKHQYNFSFVLPLMLPSSYEGTYGRISYMCKVSIQRDKKKELAYRTSFTVLSNADLNFFPNLKAPIHHAVTKEFNFLFSRQGILNFKVDLPASGFVPGQIIPIRYHAKNVGKVKITEIKYLLIRTTLFRATVPYENGKEEIIKVAHCPCEGINPDEEKTVDAFMPIPPLPPSSIPQIISIIHVRYTLKVKGKVFGIHAASGHLAFEIPLTIGTSPFIENNVNVNVITNVGIGLEQPSTSTERIAPPPYTEFATSPPFETVNEEHEDVDEENDNESDEENVSHERKEDLIQFPPHAPRYPVVQYDAEELPKKKL